MTLRTKTGFEGWTLATRRRQGEDERGERRCGGGVGETRRADVSGVGRGHEPGGIQQYISELQALHQKTGMALRTPTKRRAEMNEFTPRRPSSAMRYRRHRDMKMTVVYVMFARLSRREDRLPRSRVDG